MPNRFEKYLDLGDILEFWDPNQHFGERLTENLDQILHAIDCKGDAKAGWPPRAISSTLCLVCEETPWEFQKCPNGFVDA